MKKTVLMIFALACLVSVLMTSPLLAFEIVTRDMVEKEIVTETDLIKTADNFIILFDTSASTNKMVPGKDVSIIKAAKSQLKMRMPWLPDLGYQAGLYIYTNNEDPTRKLKEVYGMQAYDRDRFAAAIDTLPEEGKGPTMIQAGFRGLRDVVAGLSGKTVVFMFTDGTANLVRGPKRPLQVAQEIAADHDISFYLISSATESLDKQLLASVSKINASSRVIPLATYMDNPAYTTGALFTVKTTSYARLRPTTQVVGFIANDMLFDFDSTDIRSEYNQKLGMLGDYLQKNPDAYVVAGGFTDSVGDEEYNLALSEQRAAGVKNYLVDNFNIDRNRIVTLWFGELNPVADNATSQGRQLNRRVEIAVGTGN